MPNDPFIKSNPVEALIALHESTCEGCRETMRRKNADYSGGSGDPYSNFRISATFGIHPAMGIVLRITDKLQRIRAFTSNGVLAVETESVDDACDDIVNYAILIKGLLRHERATLESILPPTNQ